MKKFFQEFKQFISRGNVMDMAVGMIVGSAFTAIITALVNNILKPLLDCIPGMDNTSALQVVLKPEILDPETSEVLQKAVIMDFGSVITAIISFLITAFVLFLIIKAFNAVRDGGKKLQEKQKKAIEKKLKKGEITAEEAAVQKAEVEAPAVPVETSEDLLKEIRDLLKAQNGGSKTEE